MQISYLICIFINTDENFRKYRKIIKKQIFTEFCPQTVLVACYYIINDTIWQVLSSNSHIIKLYDLHIQEYLIK